MSAPWGQRRTEVPAPGGVRMTVISAAREIELEARSMLVLAEDLFRLDVIPFEDTIQTVLRSLSPGAHAELRSREVGGETHAVGGVAPHSTGRFGGEVVLVADGGGERKVARLMVGSVCHLERGITSFTAQVTLL